MIELTTVANLSLLYLLYCLINRYVRDRSVFSDLNNLNGVFNKLEKKRRDEVETVKTGGILGLREDIPVLKSPLMPKASDLNINLIKPEIKVETSFDNVRIGEYKK